MTVAKQPRDPLRVPALALDTQDAAYALGRISVGTLTDLCLRGEIAHCRIGERVVIRPEAITEYLMATEIPRRAPRPIRRKEQGDGDETALPPRIRRRAR